MLQKRLKPFAAFLCAFSVLCCTGCDFTIGPITEVNQTYEGSSIRATVTNIERKGNKVGFYFVVENKSYQNLFLAI